MLSCKSKPVKSFYTCISNPSKIPEVRRIFVLGSAIHFRNVRVMLPFCTKLFFLRWILITNTSFSQPFQSPLKILSEDFLWILSVYKKTYWKKRQIGRNNIIVVYISIGWLHKNTHHREENNKLKLVIPFFIIHFYIFSATSFDVT